MLQATIATHQRQSPRWIWLALVNVLITVVGVAFWLFAWIGALLFIGGEGLDSSVPLAYYLVPLL